MPAKLKLRQEFPYSVEKILKAREQRYNNIEKFPELKEQIILEKSRDGEVVYTLRQLGIGDKIPDIVKKVVPAGMLKLLDESRFDFSKNENNFEVYADGNKDKFLITGKTNYLDLGAEKSARESTLIFNVNFPLIGGLIASQIRDSYRKSLERDHKLLIELAGEIK